MSSSHTWQTGIAAVEIGLLLASCAVAIVLLVWRRQSILLLRRSLTFSVAVVAGALFTLYSPVRTIIGEANFSCDALILCYIFVSQLISSWFPQLRFQL
jgi:hypothetical protein